MSGWTAKRFWKQATAEACEGGFTVLLDGRRVKTPAKTPLVVPTLAMAQAIAEEWDAQEGEIKPQIMPVTRSANAALDKVATQHAEVAGLIADYGGTDLLCYRATSPEELIARQAATWDPVLDWAAENLGARLNVGAGVMHVEQDEVILAGLHQRVRDMDSFALAAFHDLVGLSGSLILGFAAIYDTYPAETLWDMSRVDETWQEEQWGVDEEAAELAATKKQAFLHAKRFFDLSRLA
ncbi:ATPase [Thalassobius vesicularis]|uniref:ATPase n=1 Tax=Thalassobius vesicularis TaxID=1294297 RepID=A0A4V3UZA8_9RHOB|nr:ATP12 family protein [Thalassobius vesicularis]THD76029.1 ATPase [Thalassobius vesicularis]